MNLVVDFGNTRIKAALFKGSEIVMQRTYSLVEQLIDDELFYKGAQKVIVGSVTNKHLIFINTVANKQKVMLFEASTPIPLKNLYKSVSTLGSDRIAASVGAFSLFPNQNVLTIDAGTCIKYNFVNKNNEFIGGAISPGMEMRLKAMHHFTNRLPLVQIDFNYDKLTGANTQESLLSGALVGASAEAESMIEHYLKTFQNLKVVLCGGDSHYLCKQLKNRFFAQPDLVLLGLNTILNFNSEK